MNKVIDLEEELKFSRSSLRGNASDMKPFNQLQEMIDRELQIDRTQSKFDVKQIEETVDEAVQKAFAFQNRRN